MIIALGRSDNHALLSSHARHIGVDYLGLEADEASEFVREPAALQRWIEKVDGDGPRYLAAIDSSVAPSTLRSFFTLVQERSRFPLILRSEPELLETLRSTGDEEVSTDRNPKDRLFLLSIARSPHNQFGIWPVIGLSDDGRVMRVEEMTSRNPSDEVRMKEEEFDQIIARALDRAIAEASSLSLVGVINYVLDPLSATVISREFGLSAFTFWSESASYTSVSEQLVRTILDLPLGDCRTIDYEEYFLQEELELDPREIQDPIRPFLHLFARNPRLKVRYHRDEPDREFRRATLSLFASSQQEALDEMSHARDFMLGR